MIHLSNWWHWNGNVNVAKPDWAWFQVHRFACEGLMCCCWCLWKRCPYVCCSGWWLLSLWLHFNCNEHLTLFRCYSKRDSQWFTGSQFSNNIPHNCLCAPVHVLQCVVVLVFPWVNVYIHGVFEVCLGCMRMYSEFKRNNVWVWDCICSFTFGAVSVWVSSTLWCFSVLGLICWGFPC